MADTVEQVEDLGPREVWRSILDSRPEHPGFFLAFATGALEVWDQLKDQPLDALSQYCSDESEKSYCASRNHVISRSEIRHSDDDRCFIDEENLKNSYEIDSAAGLARVQIKPEKTEVWRLRLRANREVIQDKS